MMKLSETKNNKCSVAHEFPKFTENNLFFRQSSTAPKIDSSWTRSLTPYIGRIAVIKRKCDAKISVSLGLGDKFVIFGNSILNSCFFSLALPVNKTNFNRMTKTGKILKAINRKWIWPKISIERGILLSNWNVCLIVCVTFSIIFFNFLWILQTFIHLFVSIFVRFRLCLGMEMLLVGHSFFSRMWHHARMDTMLVGTY